MIIKVADINFSFNQRYNHTFWLCRKYKVDDAHDIDCSFKITDEEIKAEVQNNDAELSESYVESVVLNRKIAEWLPYKNAFVLHSACFEVNGVGVAFAAHSGTGKTTHMRLWQELLGDRMVVVNGDKPIIRFFDDESNTPYAYGNPWMGKERLGCNMRTPLRHICFIERAKENSIEKMEKNEIIELIFNQVYMPKEPMAALNTVSLIDRLISSCNLWKIKCNMEPEAAKIAYKAIFGNS